MVPIAVIVSVSNCISCCAESIGIYGCIAQSIAEFFPFPVYLQIALGVEYETNVQLSKALQLRMNFTYLSMTDSTQSRVNFKDTGYVYGLRRPGFQSNIVLQYSQPAWTVSISGKYVGSRSDIGGFRRADVLLPAYFLLGAYAEYRYNERLKIFIDTQNITNNRFTDLRGFNGIPFIVNSGISVQL